MPGITDVLIRGNVLQANGGTPVKNDDPTGACFADNRIDGAIDAPPSACPAAPADVGYRAP